MKNCLVLSEILSVTLIVMIVVAKASREIPPQKCDELCFCPCRLPGGNVINPPTWCLERIQCSETPECSAQVIACYKPTPTELCFCPCRIPFCGPDALYYPSLSCLKRIKCTHRQVECSAEYINGSGK